MWGGTRGDIFGTNGDLVVLCKASLVLALVQTRILALDLDQAKQYKFPVAPMGVLAPGSAHARPSARPPITTSGNLYKLRCVFKY